MRADVSDDELREVALADAVGKRNHTESDSQGSQAKGALVSLVVNKCNKDQR